MAVEADAMPEQGTMQACLWKGLQRALAFCPLCSSFLFHTLRETKKAHLLPWSQPEFLASPRGGEREAAFGWLPPLSTAQFPPLCISVPITRNEMKSPWGNSATCALPALCSSEDLGLVSGSGHMPLATPLASLGTGMLHRPGGWGFLDGLKKEAGPFLFLLFFNLTSRYFPPHILKLSELDENHFSWCLIGFFL